MRSKPGNQINVELPAKFQDLFKPARYKVYKGGRGGAKSWAFASALVLLATQKKLRILCTRELQNSMADSVHRLIIDRIEVFGLSRYFEVLKQSITCKTSGSVFIFKGIKVDPLAIKSTEGVDICWVEEAEKVSKTSWEVLRPTIRKAHSEIWISFNPNLETDPTYQQFVLNKPDDCILHHVTWRDNPWFPEVLRLEKDHLARVDPEAYMHVWEGECRTNSESQVLKDKYLIDSFEPDASFGAPMFGVDWGFAVDPTVMIKCWVKERTLYIESEAYGVGVEIDALPQLFNTIENSSKYVSRADNARPETISYMRRNGYQLIEAVDKWKGSVEDGVAHLRGYEKIVIHPRCKHTIDEARLWSYKTNRLTGDILPELEDKHNHCWDAIRYALTPMIKRSAFNIYALI